MSRQSNMQQEIDEQPEIIRSLAPYWEKEAGKYRSAIANARNIYLLGRGSSGNACTYTSYLCTLKKGIHPIEFRPWCASAPLPAVDLRQDVVLAYSVSGESTDVIRAARWLKDQGAMVIGITNSGTKECFLGDVTDNLFQLNVGRERAVPSTKTFTAQLLSAAALLGYPLVDKAEVLADIFTELSNHNVVPDLMQLLNGSRFISWLARGPSLAAAQDASLKVRETSGLSSFAWSLAEFLHGPIRALSSDDRAILLIDSIHQEKEVEAILSNLISRGITFVCICDKELKVPWPEAATLRVRLPNERWLTAPVFAYISQIFALKLAEDLELNPDKPDGLSKITLTD